MTPYITKPSAPEPETKRPQEPIPVDGFTQVVEMLQYADAEFRESLLARLNKRDPKLATQIRGELNRRARS